MAGNAKLGYPQTRVMKMNFPESPEKGEQLLKGEKIQVVGASNRRGHLIVEHNGYEFHVPYQYMELATATPADSVSITATNPGNMNQVVNGGVTGSGRKL